MPDFRNSSFSHGPRKPFNKGPRRDFGGDREMFDAECANCHKMTQVPFRPNGKKPVFCRDCFVPEGGERSNDRPPRENRFEKREFGPKRSFGGPERAPRPPHDTRIDDLTRQVASMKETLERIASSLEKTARASALSEEVSKYREPAKAPKEKKVSVKKSAKKSGKKGSA